MTHEILIRASKNEDIGEIYLSGDDFRDVQHPRCAKPLKFREANLYETDDKTSMWSMSKNAATQLMDDLWGLGIRPTAKGDEG